MYSAEIKVTLKKSVFDPQGTTVHNSLKSLGFDTVERVRIGKYIEIVLEAADLKEAETEVDRMCDQLLANPNVETYSFNVKEVQ